MKVRIQFQDIDETLEAPDADALLKALKAQAAQRAPFLLRAIINGMSDLAFAGEAVKRTNAATERQDPPPASARDFLDWAIARGYARLEGE